MQAVPSAPHALVCAALRCPVLVQEERDGRYWCEADARYVDAAQNRYVLNARVADATGETYVSVFNDQVRLLPCTSGCGWVGG